MRLNTSSGTTIHQARILEANQVAGKRRHRHRIAGEPAAAQLGGRQLTTRSSAAVTTTAAPWLAGDKADREQGDKPDGGQQPSTDTGGLEMPWAMAGGAGERSSPTPRAGERWPRPSSRLVGNLLSRAWCPCGLRAGGRGTRAQVSRAQAASAHPRDQGFQRAASQPGRRVGSVKSPVFTLRQGAVAPRYTGRLAGEALVDSEPDELGREEMPSLVNT